MPTKKIKDFLDANQVKYVCLVHSPAYTAQEIAASADISGRELAKSVVVKIDGRFALMVLPAPEKVDLELLMEASGAGKVALANEEEFKDLFPGCELGAMPPFGNLYGLEVYASESLTRDERIAFNAGSHSELVQMSFTDFARLVQPKVVRF